MKLHLICTFCGMEVYLFKLCEFKYTQSSKIMRIRTAVYIEWMIPSFPQWEWIRLVVSRGYKSGPVSLASVQFCIPAMRWAASCTGYDSSIRGYACLCHVASKCELATTSGAWAEERQCSSAGRKPDSYRAFERPSFMQWLPAKCERHLDLTTCGLIQHEIWPIVLCIMWTFIESYHAPGTALSTFCTWTHLVSRIHPICPGWASRPWKIRLCSQLMWERKLYFIMFILMEWRELALK